MKMYIIIFIKTSTLNFNQVDLPMCTNAFAFAF